MYDHYKSDPDPATKVNYKKNVSIKWYLKGELNACYNCVDRHLQERGNKIAIIWEGDNPKDSKKITYKELYLEVCKFSNALKNIGTKKGDVVTVEPGVRHEFSSIDGCIIEEVSSTHYVDDSYYTDESISQNKNRKTFVTEWTGWDFLKK